MLRENREFRLMFIANAVSKFGDKITLFALPLVALTVLDASAFTVGALTAVGVLPFLLVSLPAGVFVDRRPRRPILMATDLLSAVAIASVPLAALLDALSLSQLFAVALLAGISSVFSDVANVSFLPALVTGERLVDANARNTVAAEVADFSGPALAGLAVGAFGAAAVLVADAVSFAVSFVLVALIGVVERIPARTAPTTVRRDIAEGLRYVRASPLLMLMSLNGFLLNTSATALTVAQPLLLVRELHLAVGVYGVVVAFGAVGGIAGGMVAATTVRNAGNLRAMSAAAVVTIPAVIIMAFAGRGWAVAPYAIGLALMSGATSVLSVAKLNYRLRSCPAELQGRLTATTRFLTWSGMPLGALLAGTVAGAASPRAALLCFVGIVVLSAVPMLFVRDRTTRVAAVARS